MEQIKKILTSKKIIIIFIALGILLMFVGKGGREDNSASVSLPEETRLCRVLSRIEGAGEVDVMLTLSDESSSPFSQKTDAQYLGAVILAQGGDNSVVREKIIKAVQVVTGLQPHKIVVYRLNPRSK